METIDNLESDSNISYEGAPIAEAALEGIDYRVDAGRGSAVAISQRDAGTWTWTLVADGRWDGVRLRAKGLHHTVVVRLAEALASAMSEQDELGFT